MTDTHGVYQPIDTYAPARWDLRDNVIVSLDPPEGRKLGRWVHAWVTGIGWRRGVVRGFSPGDPVNVSLDDGTTVLVDPMDVRWLQVAPKADRFTVTRQQLEDIRAAVVDNPDYAARSRSLDLVHSLIGPTPEPRKTPQQAVAEALAVLDGSLNPTWDAGFQRHKDAAGEVIASLVANGYEIIDVREETTNG
jgi:hypothetical protein